MGLSRSAVFLLTAVAVFTLIFLFKKNKDNQEHVVMYSIGDKAYQTDEHVVDHHAVRGLLHREQVIEKAKPNGDLIVVEVEFPKNGQDFIVMLVSVTNYNSKHAVAHLARTAKDENFWVMIHEGAIGSNFVVVELNSYLDIDADVEFFGYKNDTTDYHPL